ncbi:MAG: GTPase HflX [Firmicutes bacterium]|nr:GTPase HflX [Bacillota bacterium]
MEELHALAEAADINVLAEMTQTLDKINAGTFIGSGKLSELKEMASNMEADLVIFNDELSGMQLRNIEDAVGVRIIDRTMLILDIFASRASSKEGKLQVELAQLQYRMPRLLGFGKSLSRLGGGIGTRGPGEKKLETDRRHIERRMDDIKREMKEVQKDRSTQRQKREKSGIPVAALVGYTNSGKSSILNRFLAAGSREDKQVFEKDMLFATLDTSERLVQSDEQHSFILVDTVGFVSKLPHSLINAFKATLEEALSADVLIHVVDASFKDAAFHIEVTNSVLKELKADDKPCILVFNKCDLIDNKDSLDLLPASKDAIFTSVKTGEGFDALADAVNAALFSDRKTYRLLIPYEDGSVSSALLNKCVPFVNEYREDGNYLEIELDKADAGRYAKYILND